MSSANLPSTLSISEHGIHTQKIDDPDLVAKQLQEAAFVPIGPNKFEKRRQSRFDDDNPIVATVEIDEGASEVEISARDHVGVTPLTPSSSLEIQPKIDWDQVFNVFLEVHRYERTFDYHGVPITNFLADSKDLEDIFLIVAANYLRNLQPILRHGLIRSFRSRRVDAVDAHGRIDIKKSIWNYKSGIPKQHFITKEPDYNVPANRLIHAAGKYLLTLFRHNAPSGTHRGYYSIFSDVRDKVEYLERRGISSELSDVEEYRRITVGMLPPQRGYYGEAIRISKTILSSATGRPLTGGEEQLTMDYLINMDSLFQDYSQIVLEQQAKKIVDQSLDEDLNIEVKDEPTYSPFEDIRTNIEPDHIVCKNGEFIAILDTKYYSDGRDPTRNRNNREQMYRYSTILGIDEMTFICPATKAQSRTIRPSGKQINVISPEEFSTDRYEICILEYLEELLDISTLETQLYQDVQEGHICIDDTEGASLQELLAKDAFSAPFGLPFYRAVQNHVAEECSSVPSPDHVTRIYGELNNQVYNRIKEKVDQRPEWTDLVVPVFCEVETDEGIEERVQFHYIGVKDGRIEQLDSTSMVVEWA